MQIVKQKKKQNKKVKMRNEMLSKMQNKMLSEIVEQNENKKRLNLLNLTVFIFQLVKLVGLKILH